MKKVVKICFCEKGQSSIEIILCLPIVLASSFAFILLGVTSMAHQIHLYGAHEFLLCKTLNPKSRSCKVEYKERTHLFSALLQTEAHVFQRSKDRWRLEVIELGPSIPLLNVQPRFKNTFDMKLYQRSSHDR